jgi:hypothetical protein
MAIPAAPVENGGDKLHFLVYDSGGTNAAAVWRGFRVATVNGSTLAEAGVYPTSGALENGAKQMTGGARIAISSTSVPCQGVIVKAYSDNATTLYVGKSDVTADKTAATGGYPLEPGESVGVPCRNANEVYVIGTGTDGVAWIASAD